MDAKVQLLETVLGRSIKAHRDNVSFHCPFCNHEKPKLNVSLGTGKWGCWVCGDVSQGNSIVTLMHRLKVKSDVVDRAKSLWSIRDHSEVNKKQILTLPPEYLPIHQPKNTYQYKIATNYLKNRNIDMRLAIKYDIGYCEYGRYRGRIILPSYDENGYLNSYVGRTYLPGEPTNYLAPPDLDKDSIIVYEDHINWKEPVILVEGRFDAIAVRRNAIPIDGKNIPQKLKDRILTNRTDVYICLDADARSTANRHCSYFIRNGVRTFMVNLPDNEDPGSLGYDGVWRCIDRAVEVSESDNFETNLKARLFA